MIILGKTILIFRQSGRVFAGGGLSFYLLFSDVLSLCAILIVIFVDLSTFVSAILNFHSSYSVWFSGIFHCKFDDSSNEFWLFFVTSWLFVTIFHFLKVSINLWFFLVFFGSYCNLFRLVIVFSDITLIKFSVDFSLNPVTSPGDSYCFDSLTLSMTFFTILRLFYFLWFFNQLWCASLFSLNCSLNWASARFSNDS